MSHGPGLGDVGSPSFQKSKYLASLSIVGVAPEKGPGMPAGSPVKCAEAPEPCLPEPMGLEFLCAASPLGSREQLFLKETVGASLLAP